MFFDLATIFSFITGLFSSIHESLKRQLRDGKEKRSTDSALWYSSIIIILKGTPDPSQNKRK